jgi:hypothetical protein
MEIELVERIDKALQTCRTAVLEYSELPFLRLMNQFDFSQFRYEIVESISMKFDFRGVSLITRYIYNLFRLVALLIHIRSNLQNNCKVTKRSLYYQLLKYYKGDYRQVSEDVKILTYTLGVKREHLGIIASSRGMLSGNLILQVEGELKSVDNSSYFHLPTECRFSIEEL